MFMDTILVVREHLKLKEPAQIWLVEVEADGDVAIEGRWV